MFISFLLLYFFYFTRLASPKDYQKIEFQGIIVELEYCRPAKRDRLIFGSEDDGALVPYGKYWRLGANAATEISFNRTINFGGKAVPEGRYRFYAIPGEDNWEFVLNTELGKWGLPGPDKDLDVVSIFRPTETMEDPLELFTMNLNTTDTAAILNIAWDNTYLSIPIKHE